MGQGRAPLPTCTAEGGAFPSGRGFWVPLIPTSLASLSPHEEEQSLGVRGGRDQEGALRAWGSSVCHPSQDKWLGSRTLPCLPRPCAAFLLPGAFVFQT